MYNDNDLYDAEATQHTDPRPTLSREERRNEEEPFEKGGIPMDGRNSFMPAVIFSVALIIFGIMAYIVTNRYVQSQAVADCLDAARVEAVNGGAERVGAPESYWFNVCLEKSGFGE